MPKTPLKTILRHFCIRGKENHYDGKENRNKRQIITFHVCSLPEARKMVTLT